MFTSISTKNKSSGHIKSPDSLRPGLFNKSWQIKGLNSHQQQPD